MVPTKEGFFFEKSMDEGKKLHAKIAEKREMETNNIEVREKSSISVQFEM